MPFELSPGVTVYVEPPGIPVLYAVPPGSSGSITGPAGPQGPTGPQGPAGGGSGGISETIVNAKGDLIAATAADVVTRLGVGSNGQVLTADSAQSTGLTWSTTPGGGIPATIVDAKGDLIAATAADTVARVPAGSTDGHVLTRSAAASTGMAWVAPVSGSGHVIQDETVVRPQRTNLNLTGAGVSVSDDAAFDTTNIIITGAAWDNDTAAANGVAKLNHSFTNLLANSGMGTWSNGVTVAPPSFVLQGSGPPTISRVASSVAGEYAARVVFINQSDEFFQTFNVPTIGEWYTFTAVVRRVSGVGNLQAIMLRHAYPYNNYFTLNPIPVGASSHIITITGQVSFVGLVRVGFQQISANGVGSTWEFEAWTLQKGKGVSTSYTPAAIDDSSIQTIYGQKTFAIPPVILGDDVGSFIPVTPFGQVYSISPVHNTAYSCVVSDTRNLISVKDPINTSNHIVVYVAVIQDSVGNRPVAITPTTMAWQHGTNLVPPSTTTGGFLPESTITGPPNSIIIMEFEWLGPLLGWFAKVTHNIPPFFTVPVSPWVNPAASPTSQTLHLPIKIMRNTPSNISDGIINGLTKFFSAAWRQRMANNGLDVEISPRYPTDGAIAGANFRGLTSGLAYENVGGFYAGGNFKTMTCMGWFEADGPQRLLGHEMGHAEDNLYWTASSPAPGFPYTTYTEVNQYPFIITLYEDCVAAGGGRAFVYNIANPEWLANFFRDRRLGSNATTIYPGETSGSQSILYGQLGPSSGVLSMPGDWTGPASTRDRGTPQQRMDRFNNFVGTTLGMIL